MDVAIKRNYKFYALSLPGAKVMTKFSESSGIQLASVRLQGKAENVSLQM